MENSEEIILLEKFIMNNPELEKLESLLSKFNVFETLNIVKAEIRHSYVLAWLLNPNGNHGIGSYFIKQFLKYLISKNQSYLGDKISVFDFEVFNYSEVEIFREWKNIDLLLILTEEDKKVVITIENKVSTTEHSDQLQRYRAIIENEFKDCIKIFVYLTPEELTPSDQEWITFNYEIIADLLDNLIHSKQGTLNENILNFISHYKTILRRYIVGNSEIEQIAKQIYKKHQQALDLIFLYRPDLISEISEYLQDQLKLNPKILVDRAGKTQIKFTSKILDDCVDKISEGGWSAQSRIILFEFTFRDFRSVLRLYVGPGDVEYRKKLIEFFREDKLGLKLFKLAERTPGKKFLAVYQKEFLKEKDYEDANFVELKPKLDKKFSEFLKEDLVKIEEYFQKEWTGF